MGRVLEDSGERLLESGSDRLLEGGITLAGIPTPIVHQPGVVTLRHIKKGDSGDPGAVQVLDTWWVPQPIDGVNGEGGFVSGQREHRLSEAGTGSLLFPNGAGADGVLHRRRFDVFYDLDYGPGDEWIEATWEDEPRPFTVLTPTRDSELSLSRLTLQGVDGFGALNRARETAAGDWHHAPRDVIEHYLGVWTARAANDMETDPTADGLWTAENGAVIGPGKYRLTTDGSGDPGTDGNIVGDGVNVYGWGRDSTVYRDRTRCVRFEGLIEILPTLESNVHFGFADTIQPGFYASMEIDAEQGYVLPYTGARFGANADYIGNARSFPNHGSSWHFAVELRGPWAYFYVDGTLIAVLPALFESINPGGHDGIAAMAPYVSIGTIAGSIDIEHLLVREHRPFLLRNPDDPDDRPSDPGDLHLPGIPPEGGLWGQYFDEANMRLEAGVGGDTIFYDDVATKSTGTLAGQYLTGVPPEEVQWGNVGDTSPNMLVDATAGYYYRNCSGGADADENSGHFAITAGGDPIGEYGPATIRLEVAPANNPVNSAANIEHQGPVAWVDANNWIMATVRSTQYGGSAGARLRVRKRVGGVVSTLAEVDVPTWLANEWHTIRMTLTPDDEWFVSIQPTDGGAALVLSGTDADLTGALSVAGRHWGMYDAATWTGAGNHYFRGFRVNDLPYTYPYMQRILNPTLEPAYERQDAQLAFAEAMPPTWQAISTPEGGWFNVRWTGAIYLDFDSSDQFLQFVVGGAGRPEPDHLRVWIGKTMWGDQLIDTFNEDQPATTLTTPSLHTHLGVDAVSGWYPIVVEYAHVTESAGITMSRGADAAGPFSTVPSSDLSPIGVWDGATRFEPHDELVTAIAQSFGYQFVTEPRSLESGEFPCTVKPRKRVGRDTDYVLESGAAGDLVRKVNAEDVAETLLGDAQGLGRDDQSQITAERIDFSRIKDSFFVRSDHESLSDISSPQLLEQRLDSLLALRGGPWEEVGARPPGWKELRDSFPLANELEEFDWTPGDGVRLSFPELDVEDAAPRQIMGVTRAFVPGGLGQFTAAFRQRTRNLRAMIRRISRLQAVRNRHYQGQISSIDGTLGVHGAGYDPYTRVVVPLSVQKILSATLHVLSKTGTGLCDVFVNDVSWYGIYQVGDLDVTDAVQYELSQSSDRGIGIHLISDQPEEIVGYVLDLRVVV